ncbi:hypothetical protein KL949_003487 [Ogataea haglerorum]|nr:hypothetical protein KL915_002768 [Ogataea haglerorum]KAG7706781.1 hypothetical protein KL914_002665 [Ogataea haglerorum]KAG7716408.1 hypothetical protein KL913_003619 [Ogataea haglerorum]KAG7716891.1 hypothetical protein KL949_003487 [Ogataea haglerorum]KAG7809945.1 hypothetical protein KL924_002213 [Ogataea haglerorum]
MDRRAALEAKRAKLEELRRKRLAREAHIADTSRPGPQRISSTEQDEHNNKENEPVQRAPKPVLSEPARTDASSDFVPAQSHVDPPVLLEKSTSTDDEQDRRQLEQEIRQKLEREIREQLQREFELKLQAQAYKPDLTPLLGSPIPPQNENRNSVYAAAKEEPGVSSAFVTAQKLLFSDAVASMAVSSVDWSPHYPELVAAAYSGTHRPCCIVVWNTRTLAPEFSLQTYTDVAVVKFVKSRSNQLLAGGVDGRLYLYEFDSSTKYPVASTASSGKYPVVAILETSNSVVGVSSDGAVSVHSKNLMTAISRSRLALGEKFHITACSIKQNHLLLGLSTGRVYRVELGSLDDPAALQLLSATACPLPVVCIDHDAQTAVSCALDYKVKVLENGELHTIHTSNLVADVSLGREPQTFVTVGPDGAVEFWNLAANRHASLGSMNLGVPLNRVEWSPDGRAVACGAADGRVYLEIL